MVKLTPVQEDKVVKPKAAAGFRVRNLFGVCQCAVSSNHGRGTYIKPLGGAGAPSVHVRTEFAIAARAVLYHCEFLVLGVRHGR